MLTLTAGTADFLDDGGSAIVLCVIWIRFGMWLTGPFWLVGVDKGETASVKTVFCLASLPDEYFWVKFRVKSMIWTVLWAVAGTTGEDVLITWAAGGVLTTIGCARPVVLCSVWIEVVGTCTVPEEETTIIGVVMMEFSETTIS